MPILFFLGRQQKSLEMNKSRDALSNTSIVLPQVVELESVITICPAFMLFSEIQLGFRTFVH